MTAYTWAAGPDGIAHAARPGHARTLCDRKPQDPRWSWPESERCATCLLLEGSPHVALSTTSAPTSAGAGPLPERVASVPPARSAYPTT